MYNLNKSVSAIYVHSNPYGPATGAIKIYIPTLMPEISMGVARITPASLNKSCFSNAQDCKPSISSMINTQNYVTVTSTYSQNNYYYYYYYYYYYCYYLAGLLRLNIQTHQIV